MSIIVFRFSSDFKYSKKSSRSYYTSPSNIKNPSPLIY
jgi:hypothetical protein